MITIDDVIEAIEMGLLINQIEVDSIRVISYPEDITKIDVKIDFDDRDSRFIQIDVSETWQ